MTQKIDLLAYIQWHITRFGYAPTMQDMADAHNLSKPAVLARLRKLRAEGKLAYEDKVARSYRVL